ncbi:flagellar hook-basal body protein [Siminovitchia sp. 179-K 8D1 HS]|uniref:flagellar hook-basal body protein n=1 Tax=Siminovitchia sp. 179-K 8D1 HS TaxID=3142385 RepID=UPI0039A38E2C
MLRGLYTAVSGMYASQRKTEMLSNNMANAQTPGYKADQAYSRAFPEMLLDRMDPSGMIQSRRIGSLHTGVYVQEVIPRFIQGDLRQTDRPTDLAVSDRGNGAVLFSIEQNGQVKYTRNGRFTVDPSGFLTTESGYYVLDENSNRIRVNSSQFHVDGEGRIIENGVQGARLRLAVSENPDTLLKEGDGLYRTENGALLPMAENGTYEISQGFIEGSNVDLARSMTDMLASYRAFEANQKVLQAYDKSLDKAVNEIGRLNG